MRFPQPQVTSHKLLVSPQAPLETRPVSSCSLRTTDMSFRLTTKTTMCFLVIVNPSRRPAYATLLLV